ncbi:MAG: hypothetical protein WCX64_05400 [Candidatus Micrarchaeia archaeon]
MKTAFIFLFLALTCVFASAAKAPQEQVIAVSATEAPALVEVRGALDFPYFVPDVENRANVTIGLALSKMSLSTITSGSLTVYVLVTPKRNDSLLYFGGNPGAKSYYLTLNCTIVDGACASGSVTERTIGVCFKSSSAAPLAGDGVILLASISPLISEQVNTSEIALDQTAYDQIGDLQARILQAASGIFGLAANATSGVLSSMSVTVTTNSSDSTNSTDPLLVAAAQAAADAKKSIIEGDNETASRLVNKSESLLAQYAQRQSGASAGTGMFFSSLAKPEVAALACVIIVGAFAFYRFKQGKRKPRQGRNGIFDFDGL